jgi:hypothetical protein
MPSVAGSQEAGSTPASFAASARSPREILPLAAASAGLVGQEGPLAEHEVQCFQLRSQSHFPSFQDLRVASAGHGGCKFGHGRLEPPEVEVE